MDISIRLEGDAVLALREIARRMSDLTPLNAEVAASMHDQTLARFASEKGPDGTAWKKSARAAEDGGKTLQQHGLLIGAIKPEYDGKEAVVGVEATAAPAIYARIHQLGGKIIPKVGKVLNTPFGKFASVTMPARPYLGFSADDRSEIATILRDHLHKILTGDPKK